MTWKAVWPPERDAIHSRARTGRLQSSGTRAPCGRPVRTSTGWGMSKHSGTGAGRRWTVMALTALLALLGGAVAQAQALPGAMRADPAGRKAVHDFVLDEAFLHKLEGVAHDADRMRVRPSIDSSHVQTLAGMIARLRATPAARQLLARHGLSARDYLTGSFALAGAALVVAMREDPRMTHYVDARHVNEANVRFYLAHRVEVDQLLHIPAPAAAGSR